MTKRRRVVWGLVVVVCSLSISGLAQESAATAAAATASSTATVSSAVPGLINYSGVLKDDSGKAITGITGRSGWCSLKSRTSSLT